MAPHRPHFGSILEAIFIENQNVEWKKGSKKWIKKRVPALTETGDDDHGPGLPDSPPRVRAFLNKKQLSEQETRTAAHFWIHFRALFLEWAIFDFMSEEMLICWWNLKQKRQVIADVFFLWFLSKGPWSDTLWAKALRILKSRATVSHFSDAPPPKV